MIASLPMYDWPEVKSATDDWWQGLARAFRNEGLADVPTDLLRGGHESNGWKDSNLLFSQTCGYPYTHGGTDTLQLVATPCYQLDGCEGPDYRSFILCREETSVDGLADFKGGRAAINNIGSQSGYSALRAVIAPIANKEAFFGNVMLSGGHRYSMNMVRRGEADLCAVDSVCYALAKTYVPELLIGLKIIASSPAAPGLPYVTARAASKDQLKRIQAGTLTAMSDPDLSTARDTLFIGGARMLTDLDYGRILDIEHDAIALGYPDVS